MSDGFGFRKVGVNYAGKPVHLVYSAGVDVGLIERVTASTDTKIGRLRKPGKGREEWRPVCGFNHVNRQWDTQRPFMPGLSYLTRSDAANQFDRRWGHGPMDQGLIDRLVEKYAAMAAVAGGEGK